MVVPSRICTACDTPLPEGASYCPVCGVALPSEISAEAGEVRSGLTIEADEAEYREPATSTGRVSLRSVVGDGHSVARQAQRGVNALLSTFKVRQD